MTTPLRRRFSFRGETVLEPFSMTEFLALGFVEFAACFLLALAVVAGGEVFSNAMILDLSGTIAAVLVGMSTVIGTYRGQSFMRRGGLLTRAVLALAASLACALLVVAVRDGQNAPTDIGPLRVVAAAGLACLLVIGLTRAVFAYALRSGVFVRRIAILGEPAAAARLRAALEMRNCGDFAIAAEIDPAAPDAATRLAALRGADLWAAVLVQDAGPAGLAAALASPGLPRIVEAADFWERRIQRIDLDTLDRNILPRSRGQGLSALLHRLGDLFLGGSLLFFTLPLMVFTAIAIRLDSKGPIFYRQERVGYRGRPFMLIKFRSMRPDAEASGPVWAMEQDRRITRVGQFIRLTRIDELPQLFNILRGEMSFIGPRPERPVFVEQLAEKIPFYNDRHGVKPGLTGWAQVNYPYGASVEDARRKLSYDLYYVKRQNFLLDAIIFFSTVRVILFQEGAR
jgi:exopolysaccharide biosynthesis polyprenyl glycosylphosphotransferase